MANTTRKPSILAGISLLIMAVAAGYSFAYVHTQIIVDSVSMTMKNIQSSSLFTTGLIGWSIVIVADIIVTWAFLKVLEPINKRLALLSFITRAVYTVFLVTAVYNLFIINFNINSLSGLEVMHHIDKFDSIWSLGLIIFGVHLSVVGIVVLINNQKILGSLLILAGVGYTFIHILRSFYPLFTATATIETILILPMTIGELGYGIYLLIKGGKESSI